MKLSKQQLRSIIKEELTKGAKPTLSNLIKQGYSREDSIEYLKDYEHAMSRGSEIGTNVKNPSSSDPNYVVVKCVNNSLKMLREIKKTLSGAIEGIDFIIDDEEDTTYDDVAQEVEASVKRLYELMCGEE